MSDAKQIKEEIRILEDKLLDIQDKCSHPDVCQITTKFKGAEIVICSLCERTEVIN